MQEQSEVKNVPSLLDLIRWVMRRVYYSSGEMDKVSIDVTAVGSEAFALRYEVMSLLTDYGKKVKKRSPSAYTQISSNIRKLKAAKMKPSSPSITIRIDGRKVLNRGDGKDPVAVSLYTYVGKESILVTLFPSLLGVKLDE